MFDLDASKIVMVGVAALIFIPPKDLPRVMRQVGQFVGKMKRMAGEFQGQFMDAMREADMADLRKEAQKLSDAARIDTGLSSAHDIERQMGPLAARPAYPAPELKPDGAAQPRMPSDPDAAGSPAHPTVPDASFATGTVPARVEPAPEHTA